MAFHAHGLVSAILGLFCCASTGLPRDRPPAEPCAALTSEVRSRLSAYVADEYQLAPDLSIEDAGLVQGTCFRRLIVTALAPLRSPLMLFLSPDQRFLFGGLMDTMVNPSLERLRVARETNDALQSEPSPSVGPSSASVTLVEFSDFQCPFCKRFASVLDGLPKEERESIRVVFKHRPLGMHAWARSAARFSICASQQSDEAFWGFQEFVFANQKELTPENFGEKAGQFAASDRRLDSDLLKRCVETGGAEDVLLRDEKLANLYHVNSVPTVFVNGVRTPGFGSVEELKAAIAQARSDLRLSAH